MKHDELLNKLNKLPEAIGLAEFKVRHDALLAVVELHTPATKNSFRNNDCICMLPNRKCATIQAIERVLN